MIVVCLDCAPCNGGSEEHNVSVFSVTTVSSKQWYNVMKENVSDEMVWSDMANDTKERWQKVMELSSNNGSGLSEGHLWNSQLKLAHGNPVPSFSYQCCDWPNHLKPPYIIETCFSCHITSASMRIDSVTLKMEAVRSSEIGRFNQNAVQKLNTWPSSIKILQKWGCVAILILPVNVDPHYSYPVWCWRFEQLWLFRFSLFGWNTVQCGRHVPMQQKNLLPAWWWKQ